MGWIKHTPPAPSTHQCTPPTHRPVRTYRGLNGEQKIMAPYPRPDGAVGDLWGCDTCGVVWQIVLHQPRYRRGYGPSSLRWERASWWKQRKYGPRYTCGCRIGGPRTCDKRYDRVTRGVVPVHGALPAHTAPYQHDDDEHDEVHS